ncbi:MetQ/NlpA family ABC transporter substrate-binding protein [Mesosutterella sp. OilRF-GAM-744-9]|uniref:MetQ/NlpA family ABC transporter substrate-binding protein n=2 Tax=Mesosutterella TaxID=2494213 RepID=A0ABS9MPX0_9BURK|nr:MULTISPECIES: MetQ/NlpA family ABC transporter substrate-binding protein [unclassified Mesosutterella]MCG5030651.1 MetQ/NlpA family ABC transporter substrate-binding protein [Mesosutterella sp. oilRF-744-WT-GAM-9]MDL2060546.1 MetQ/NlpA family ABC transporter substrate-binding protein [Mesosutterella sp. AGMB02718]
MQKRTLFKAIGAAAASLVLAAGLTGCGDKKADSGDKIVKVGVVGDYNAQWDTVNKLLAKDHIKVELVKYSDYATPNRALNDKEIDLNAFQHKAFLANDVKQHGYKIEAIGDTLIAPLAVFNNKKKIQSIKDIKDGDTIAIPSDLTNGGRALKVLEAAGLITVDPAKGYVANKTDITKYNVKIKIMEAESGALANLLPDVTAALINGGNAFTAHLDPTKDSIFVENVDPKVNPVAAKLVNVIVARSADKDNPTYKKVVDAYHTADVAKTIKDTYHGAFIPAWEGAEK